MIDIQTYEPFLKEVVEKVNIARINTNRAINFSAIQLNYEIGELIVSKQDQYGWGKSIVEKLANDLKDIFGGIDGFSPQNLWLMRQFYLAYNENTELLELAKQIPWGQNILIIQKEKQDEARKFYLKATAELAWSRSFLQLQIKSEAYKHSRLDQKLNNFEKALTPNLSKQADESLKSV